MICFLWFNEICIETEKWLGVKIKIVYSKNRKCCNEEFGEIDIVEDHGTRKVIDVPSKDGWNSIEKWNYI